MVPAETERHAMTLKDFTSRVHEEYPRVRVKDFHSRHFQPEYYQNILDMLQSNSGGILKIRKLGESHEGRPVRLASAGSGSTGVLLWSQMHGDESTATMSIADILSYFMSGKNEPATREILASLSVHFLPMLNPDGA